MSILYCILVLQITPMNKLISYLIGLAITIIIMYIVGFFIACIITAVLFIIRQYIAYRNSKVQYTKWEVDREYPPIVTTIDGVGYFQNVTNMRRYNNFENRWEYEQIIDPVLRTFDKATSINDKYWLSYR
jgi:hypothetical protein